MIASIHQPNFIPWLGYFYKIVHSDIFIFLDDVQYNKNSFINRNKIKTPRGDQWLTLPVSHTGKYGQLISETTIIQKEKAVRKIVNSIRANYGKAQYFHTYFDELHQILTNTNENLAEINILLINWIIKLLDIKVETKRSSDLKDIINTSTERLVSLCKSIGANEYLSGFGGVQYQEEKIFRDAEINLRITDFKHPQYFQLWGDFIPSLSILDLLFNCGPESKKYLLSKNG